jgi:hypothetical protein
LFGVHSRVKIISWWWRRRLAIWLAAILLPGVLAACGGGGSSSSTSADGLPQSSNLSAGTNSGGGVTNPGGILLAAPTPVPVTANQSTISVDIQVPPVASAINATEVAVTAPQAGQAWAQAAGVGVRQGNQYWLWILGTGITPSLTLTISGPGDITLNGTAVATKGGSGVIFPIAVSAAAAPGARTIILADASNNVTTLAGALEVCNASAPSC